MSTTETRGAAANAEAAEDPLAAVPSQSSADYQNFVGLMSAHQMQCIRLAINQAKLDLAVRDAAESTRTEIAEADEMQRSLAGCIEKLIQEHPEWMNGAKSLKTPFGTVKFTRGQSLEPINEELTRLLIEEHLNPAQQALFIRRKEELNLEALGQLDDGLLKKLKVNRVETTYFKIDPARVDLNKLAKGKGVAK